MISVVIPFFNEFGSIVELIPRIEKALKACDQRVFEILIVENGSSEFEKAALGKAFATNSHVRIVSLSRNFGYQGALWAGLDMAVGNAVIFMDGDGEDPPEVIPEFVRLWREGNHVVYGIRQTRKVNPILNLCYKAFYRLLATWSEVKIPLDSGDFSLVSGPALHAIRQFRDRTRMLRIIRAWVGYRQVGFAYHRMARIDGHSKFGVWRSIKFAFDGFVSITDLPVKMASVCSLLCAGFGALGSVYYIFWYFYGSERIPGFASLNITLLLLFSMLFACISALARYVVTLLGETRRRPPYLVESDSGAVHFRQTITDSLKNAN